MGNFVRCEFCPIGEISKIAQSWSKLCRSPVGGRRAHQNHLLERPFGGRNRTFTFLSTHLYMNMHRHLLR